MRIKIFFLSTLLLMTIDVSAQKYIIDSGHSSVQINVERFGVIDVVGRFKDVQGTIFYDSENVSAISAESVIKVDSYDANNVGGEDAVKSMIFLDAATFPEITFESTGLLTKNGENFLVGNLTIHGVSNEIALPFTVNGPLMDLATQKQSIAFEASITVNRQDYGISFNRALPNGTKLVADEVDITLTILAIAE